jgi:hypothetical protein
MVGSEKLINKGVLVMKKFILFAVILLAFCGVVAYVATAQNSQTQNGQTQNSH